MKTLQNPNLYNQIRSQTGSYFEVRVIRDPNDEAVVYGMDKLKSITIHPALFEGSGPQIGGVHSTQCKIKIIEESVNWPRAAGFTVEVRASDGVNVSEWLSMGTYYTDERKYDKYGNLELIGFDAMLMLEQSWTDKVEELPSQWPITCAAAADLLVEATGIEIDSETELDNSFPCIGLDTTTTAREVYATIAAVMGGNWQITTDGKMRLVKLMNVKPSSTAISGLAITGIAIVGTGAQQGINNAEFANLGRSVVDIEMNEGLDGITNVILETSTGTQAVKRLGEGYTIKAKCDFANSDAVNVCANRVFGYIYVPFNATGALLDPIMDVGDEVEIDGKRFPIIVIDWNIAPHITASISAPFEETVDHEYSYIDSSAKTLMKALEYTDGQIETVRSFISQTETAITEGVAATYVNNEKLNQYLMNYSPTSVIENTYYKKDEVDSSVLALSSEIELTNSSLTTAFTQIMNVNNELTAITFYIRYENGTVIVGATDSPSSIRISNEQIGLYYNDECVSYWNQDEQVTPKALRIPTGGKFTLGKIMFEPRESGNMSLVWVGGDN